VLQDQLKHLVSKFGGRYMEEFDNTVTHVIMETSKLTLEHLSKHG
jgi:hypothetical protein